MNIILIFILIFIICFFTIYPSIDNFTTNNDGIKLTSNDKFNSKDTVTNKQTIYDDKDFNVEYHDSIEQIIANNNTISYNFAQPIYYKLGKYKYGIQKYVPSYTDAIILSSKNKFK